MNQNLPPSHSYTLSFSTRVLVSLSLGVLSAFLDFSSLLWKNTVPLMTLFSMVPIFMAGFICGKRLVWLAMVVSLVIWGALFFVFGPSLPKDSLWGEILGSAKNFSFFLMKLIDFGLLKTFLPALFAFLLMQQRKLPEEVKVLFGPLWYPFGRSFSLFSLLFVVCGVGSSLYFLFLGKNPQPLLSHFIEKTLIVMKYPPSTAAMVAEKGAIFFPAAVLLMFLGLVLLSLMLAFSLSRTLRANQRKTLGFNAMSVPPWYSYTFILFGAFSLLGKYFAFDNATFMSYNVSLFLAFGFSLVGLSQIRQIVAPKYLPFLHLALFLGFTFDASITWGALVFYGAFIQWSLFDTTRLKMNS